ncbi:hypothetical protein M9434_004998 [Picochlorum sp. BPE23]|nr:hypothetical protein M9434_004998 [Picochlorum sp. BPE23]KAI8101145.1 hypothetical protein M9435_001253 [Picochlorum sp. BPE23]|mmetsp:Transcript_6158/g.12072  ORF Transcript_6158/g.12072 Transcript_6158/m.12072 type:complete len:233 (+) Transcript_6158:123-821(+)
MSATSISKWLGQSLNLGGVGEFLKLRRQRSAWVTSHAPELQHTPILPHVDTPDLRNIDWEDLKRAGFKGCLFDKDNTLTEPYSLVLHPWAKESLTACVAAFGDGNVVLFSNSAGLEQFDPDGSHADAMEESLGIPVLRHRQKKPVAGPEDVEPYFMNRLEACSCRDLIMVGDRYMTDIVFGNRLGMYTIRPRPLTERGEPLAVRLSKRMEESLVESCREDGMAPPPHPFVVP